MTGTMARDRSRAEVPRAQPTIEAVVAAHSRVEARRRGSLVRTQNKANSSNKRPSSSISLSSHSCQKLAHTSAANDGMDSMLLAEAAELRGQCSQGILEAPLRYFKGLLTTSDMEYFQNSISNARKVRLVSWFMYDFHAYYDCARAIHSCRCLHAKSGATVFSGTCCDGCRT